MVGVASVWMSALSSAGHAVDGPAYDTILRQVSLIEPVGPDAQHILAVAPAPPDGVRDGRRRDEAERKGGTSTPPPVRRMGTPQSARPSASPALLADGDRIGISLLLPFVHGDAHAHAQSKLLALFLAGCPLFVLLAISTEGLFYAAYAAVLALWLAVEGAVRGAAADGERGEAYRPRMDDVRVALFFLFFVQVGFFGTGKWVICYFGRDQR
jgi:hypothetical protein